VAVFPVVLVLGVVQISKNGGRYFLL